MRTSRSSKGPFRERPFYVLKEVERICLDELIACNLFPSTPEPIRIDRFVEKRFGVVPEYKSLPDGVLGFSAFGEHGVTAIVISSELEEDGGQPAERRIRTTLAHEAGHVLLHAHLFAFENTALPIFADDTDSSAPKVLCRSGDVPGGAGSHVTPGYDGRWWEFQANMAIAALLMPRSLVEKALEPFLTIRGSLGIKAMENSQRERAALTLSRVFDVNPVVARIRIGEIYPQNDESQFSL